MKIVIIGSGKVGFSLAEQLSKESHDIIIVDNNYEALQRAQESLDVMTLAGNGTDPLIQKTAGVDLSDLLIAVTPTDEVNLLCCILAKKLGCKHTIARVRNAENERMTRLIKEDLHLSMSINPERATAREMFRLLQTPSFITRDTFARGRVELLELKITEKSAFCGLPLSKISATLNTKLLVCSVERGQTTTIPRGSFTIEAGDKITIALAAQNIPGMLKNAGIAHSKVHNVMIVGGSRIAVFLAQMLLQTHVAVKIIEKDPERCKKLSELLPSALIINDDGSNQRVLQEEGISRMDALVSLTGLDEQNIITSMYADYLGVPKTITKLSRMEYAAMLKDRNTDTLISPKLVTANEIIRYVRAMASSGSGAMLSLHRIAGGRAEACEFTVSETTHHLNIPFRALKIRRDALVASIARAGKVIIPDGDDCLKLGDTVVIVVETGTPIINLNDIFVEEPF